MARRYIIETLGFGISYGMYEMWFHNFLYLTMCGRVTSDEYCWLPRAIDNDTAHHKWEKQTNQVVLSPLLGHWTKITFSIPGSIGITTHVTYVDALELETKPTEDRSVKEAQNFRRCTLRIQISLPCSANH